ncbi:hypothetical protein QBC36DRAFT_318970 [Triangularia setosa]|uniref:Uncharacterized protein n=1 Tax=Triangularia setosa TaxID=2587417 RepID=A0AAN6WIL1_9PEZI|nr:hypothetical protein QBC36DRAFT_318970 [Podospora setosa]
MYTVIWTGRIVDRFPDCESFSNSNRATLLDRYASEYGPGWIWYEPSFSRDTNLYSGQQTRKQWPPSASGTERAGVQAGITRTSATIASAWPPNAVRSTSLAHPPALDPNLARPTEASPGHPEATSDAPKISMKNSNLEYKPLPPPTPPSLTPSSTPALPAPASSPTTSPS